MSLRHDPENHLGQFNHRRFAGCGAFGISSFALNPEHPRYGIEKARNPQIGPACCQTQPVPSNMAMNGQQGVPSSRLLLR
jgi:hypothetical protein